MTGYSALRTVAATGFVLVAIAPDTPFAQVQSTELTPKTAQEECLDRAAKKSNASEREREEAKCGVIDPAEPSVARRTNLLPLLAIPAAVGAAAAAAAAGGGEPASP